MSCVTKMIVLRSSRWIRSSSFWSRVRVIGSSAPNGSSISITRRVGREGAREPDALALAAGDLRGVAGAVVARRQVDEVEQLVGALRGLALRPAEQPRHGGDVLGDGHVREEPDLLDHVADPAAQLRLVERRDAAAVDADVARR